jgi:hypothetical protein
MSASFVALAVMLYAGAQAAPPIPGTTGTLALEGSVDKVYAGAHSALVTAGDGVKHLIHFTDRTVVHGDHDPHAPLNSLKAGSRVVVHYTMDGTRKAAVEIDRIGAGGLAEAEGVVTRIDRQAQRLSIRLADGTTETLQLSERAARDAGRGLEREADQARVVVYYTDDAGNKIAHYFKRVE